METQQNTSGGVVGKTPSDISKLAMTFLTQCGEDPRLMTQVYRTAMMLVGAEPEGSPKTTNKIVEEEKEVSSKNNALTPDEARKAKEEFRQKMGLSKLTPAQVKMAKAIFRERKSKGLPLNAPKGKTPKSPPPMPEGKKEVALKPDPTVRLEPKGSIPQLPSSGSRATWNVKLKQQRQRALERSVAVLDDNSQEIDPVTLADYYNARLTLEDTWIRFKNTYDCSGKKDPLQDLPPLPDAKAIRDGLKGLGVQARQHESGHFILQDEATGKSLRPKD